jgi:hypothetical protein
MKPRHSIAALACAWAFLAAAPAHAMAVLDVSWSDVTCGLIGADGTRSQHMCDGRSFSAYVDPGEAVFVSATLHYRYSDDGLLLPPGSWAFPGNPGVTYRMTGEAGALYLYSNQCSSFQECINRPVERIDTFNRTSTPLILGNNDVPDSLTGELQLVATSGQLATWPGGATRTAFVDASAYTISGIAPAVPEPGSYALMLRLSLAAVSR